MPGSTSTPGVWSTIELDERSLRAVVELDSTADDEAFEEACLLDELQVESVLVVQLLPNRIGHIRRTSRSFVLVSNIRTTRRRLGPVADLGASRPPRIEMFDFAETSDPPQILDRPPQV